MATFKKKLGMGFFNIKVGHLAHHHVSLPFYSKGLPFLQWFNLLPLPSWDVEL
jgi:hypothetical protein